MSTYLTVLVVLASLMSIIYAVVLRKIINKKDAGNKKMADAANSIEEAAKAFLSRRNSLAGIVSAIITVIILYLIGWKIALGFVVGVLCSGLANYLGINFSARSSVRTAQAFREDASTGMNVAFKSGGAAGFLMVGSMLFSVAVSYYIFRDTNILIGLGLGAALLSIFVGLSNGVFARAGDAVGFDCTKKTPKIIGVNATHNIKNCAGVTAGLFEICIMAILAAMILGAIRFTDFENAIYLPLVLCAVSIISSVIGSFFIHFKRNSKKVTSVLCIGLSITGVLFTAISYAVTAWLMKGNGNYSALSLYFASIIGLIMTVLMAVITNYNKPDLVQNVLKSSSSHKKARIAAESVRLIKSIILPTIVICAGMISAYFLGGLYGIALTIVTSLSFVSLAVVINVFDSIINNAQSIMQMAEMSQELSQNADIQSLANKKIRIITKGYVIVSMVLACMIIFLAFVEKFGQPSLLLDLDPRNLYIVVGFLLFIVARIVLLRVEKFEKVLGQIRLPKIKIFKKKLKGV